MMIIEIRFEAETWLVNLNKGLDISQPIDDSRDEPQCFGAKRPKFTPMSGEGWIANVSEGGSVNACEVTFNPHGNGTHTECCGHISFEKRSVHELHRDTHVIAQLITLSPKKVGKDLVITKEQLSQHIERNPSTQAIIIRTKPNQEGDKMKIFSNTNPPYFSVEAILFLVEKNIQHILVDLPSIDKEDDGGLVSGHKQFWNWPTFRGRENCTITELIYVKSTIEDGIYLLNMQRAAFNLDCAPSRPIIYPLIKKQLRSCS